MEVAEEAGRVVSLRDTGVGQDVAGRLGGGQADHLTPACLVPDAGHLSEGAGLAGAGRAGQHLSAPGGGQRVVGGRGLVQAQP